MEYVLYEFDGQFRLTFDRKKLKENLNENCIYHLSVVNENDIVYRMIKVQAKVTVRKGI